MKSGELFAGVGGLTMGVEQVFGTVPAWFSQFEPPTKSTPNPFYVIAQRPPRPGWDTPSRRRTNKADHVPRTLWGADAEGATT